jgi:glutamate-ammonia-ligase adenylyltransferase
MKIEKIVAGFFSPEQSDALFQLFINESRNHFFNRNVESNLLRMIFAMYDKTSFLLDCLKYPHYIEILFSISSNSNYLSDIIVRNPEYFYWVVNPSTLKYKLESESLKEDLKQKLNVFKTFEAKVSTLRSIKRKEILRIGLKDIFMKSGLDEITEELSILAQRISSILYQLCYQEVLSKYKLRKCPEDYCIVSLGKLGGKELNYSSDIDLIIFYENDRKLNASLTYKQVIIESTLLFIEKATEITSSGFLYRIDLRLRPDGRNSPLCRSLTEYLDYYESRGEDWERQMLIKACFVGGNKSLYEKFVRYLTPFIYPNTLTASPLEQIKRIKSNIEKRTNEVDNIKLSSGGIRDIEFSVQALQLLNGGAIKELRTGNTLNAINTLTLNKLLSEDEHKKLSEAYIFYRKVEHYIQLMNDRQTHTIPVEGEIPERLASFLKFKDVKELRGTVANHRKDVSAIFNSIINVDVQTEKENLIDEIIFVNKSKAQKNLDFLREGKGLLGNREFDKRSIDAFNLIEGHLYKRLKESVDPDRLLENFVRVIRNAQFPSIWYSEFSDAEFFNFFLKLCESCQFCIDQFSEEKELREMFLVRKVFVQPKPEQLNEMNIKQIRFLLSLQFLLGLLKRRDVSEILQSSISNFIFRKFSELNKNKIKENNFLIFALGSFANSEMSFSSDVDLVFIAEESSINNQTNKLFQNLLLALKMELKPVDVDCRLRPEGKSSQLLWGIKSYSNYILSRARIWEMQALSKAKFLAGNRNMFKLLLTSIKKRIQEERPEKIKKELLEMRKKLYPVNIGGIDEQFNLRKSRGAIADVEFIIQYFLLQNAKAFIHLIGMRTDKTALGLKEIFPEFQNTDELVSGFEFLKKVEMVLQCTFGSNLPKIPSEKAKLKLLSHNLEFKSNEDFLKELNRVTTSNHKLFNKYFGT